MKYKMCYNTSGYDTCCYERDRQYYLSRNNVVTVCVGNDIP
jgi:hypothetical protein